MEPAYLNLVRLLNEENVEYVILGGLQDLDNLMKPPL